MVRKYDWERDFPLSLSGDPQRSYSAIRFEFQLDEAEVADFKREVGLSVNGVLPIDVRFHARKPPIISIPKPGKGNKTYSAKSAEIADFIQNRIHFIYVPAVRTVEQSMSVMNQLVSERLGALETDPDYIALLDRLAQKRESYLKEVESSVSKRLESYLAGFSGIELQSEALLPRARVEDVLIDDGTRTSLRQKGDGVKSIVSLAMLHDVAEHTYPDKQVILAIEEPEAHLHPDAIHEIRKVLRGVAERRQVLLTTHSPILINRTKVSNNILVQNNRAHPTQRMEDLRNCLGVRPGDNMTSAAYCVLVEGLTDERFFRWALPLVEPRLKVAIDNGLLTFRHTGGGNGVEATAKLLLNEPIVLFAVVDGDNAGKGSRDKLVSDQLLPVENITLTTPGGHFNKELEDLLSEDTHRFVLGRHFGLDASKFVPWSQSAKWSTQAKSFLRTQGKSDDARTIDGLKVALIEHLERSEVDCLSDDSIPILKALANQIVNVLEQNHEISLV
ncbi:AAA ATPase-like protein [Arthrobacter sp. JUb115]|nr:AAA ATPase-like protein [Arthrobacter sp. JUb115]